MALFCCFFPPCHPPGPAPLFSLSGGFLRKRHHKNPPKILPSEADSFAKRAIKSPGIAPKFSSAASLKSPQTTPRRTSRTIEIYWKISYISKVFPWFCSKISPEPSPWKGCWRGECERRWSGMLAAKRSSLKGESWGFVGESVRGEVWGKVAEIKIFGF